MELPSSTPNFVYQVHSDSVTHDLLTIGFASNEPYCFLEMKVEGGARDPDNGANAIDDGRISFAANATELIGSGTMINDDSYIGDYSITICARNRDVSFMDAHCIEGIVAIIPNCKEEFVTIRLTSFGESYTIGDTALTYDFLTETGLIYVDIESCWIEQLDLFLPVAKSGSSGTYPSNFLFTDTQTSYEIF